MEERNAVTLESGERVELVSLSWERCGEIAERQESDTKSSEGRALIREALVDAYGEEVFERLRGSNRDLVRLYGATVRFSFGFNVELGN